MADKTIGITAKKAEDFSEWYTQVVAKAELADYTPVSGCIVFRPASYAIWERIQSFVDSEIKKTGHRNAYFPLFIPESLLKKEATHIEGFSPEVAWVTQAGDEKLSERLAIRPTSETIMYDSYSRWIRSWRDLPILINQWNSVVRWEFKHPKPFLRTREFLWQEGHTAHATEQDADKEVMDILNLYIRLVEELLAIPVISGKKSEQEKFAGALYTTTLEALMPDGRALQMGTSHNLGQNFAKAFGITFRGQDDKEHHVWQTSWGVSTRLIGALIMAHGDDKGLVLPPRIAPMPVVVVPIYKKGEGEQVLAVARDIATQLDAHLDERDGYSPGWKFNEWELKGVPVRIEIGPKDIEKDQAVIVRRDTGEKQFAARGELKSIVEKTLDTMQAEMLARQRDFLERNIADAPDIDALAAAIAARKLVRAGFCAGKECEEAIKEKTGATSRCIPFDAEKRKCVICQQDGNTAFFAKAY